MINLYKNLPTLDLHGVDRDYARILINEFVEDSYNLKEEKVIIIHGIGTGILRQEAAKTLKINKRVESYSLNNFNVGETIVNIKKKY